jgi:sugar fermentation stimulation protein A
MGVLPEARAVLVPCLSRPDVMDFAPGDEADPRYGSLFRDAQKAGVEILPCCFRFECNKISWQGLRPLKEISFL